MNFLLGVSVILAIQINIQSTVGQKIKDNIYVELDEIRPCFRRLNGTGEIGCTSNIGGNVGAVIYIKEVTDVSLVSDTAHAPYIVLIDPFIFSGHLLANLKDSGNVRGVILPSVTEGLWEGHYPKGYSDDSLCPNNDRNCQENSPWNPTASNTMWMDWGFPIFLVQDSNSTEKIYKCFKDYNEKTPLSWPLCSLELKSSMYGAKDSQTCIRRSNLFSITPITVCDPLSDNNIHYFVSPRNETTENNHTKAQEDKSVIVVSARLDALSIFDQVEVGFDTPSTGIVTLLTTAHLVSKAMRDLSYKSGIENVLFMLIHGESFDYIGSSRIAYDMQNKAFPYNKSKTVADQSLYQNGTQMLFTQSNVKSFIEIGQVSNSLSKRVYMHSENHPKEIVDVLRSNKGDLSVEAVEGLPPSSGPVLFNNDQSIPMVLLSNYDSQFSNPMYHSIYDSADFHKYNYSLGKDQEIVQHLASVSSMLASSIIELATGRPGVPLDKPADLVNEMLYCYTVTANCTLFYEASAPNNYPWIYTPQKRRKDPFPQYVGVRSSFHTLMTKLLLQYVTGETVSMELDDDEVPDVGKAQKACLAKNENQNVYRYVFLVGKSCYNLTSVDCGECFKTTVDTTEAASPAFLDDVKENYDWASGQYPTWTESIWKVISGRIFLQGSPSHDYGIFSLGIALFLVSILIVYWVDKNSKIIFAEQKSIEVDNPLPVEM